MITEPEWENEYDDAQKLCPRCGEGTLVPIYNDINGMPVYGCSNYPYCEYTCDELSKLLLCRKEFEKEDEFIQWLQNKGLEYNTINTYLTAVSLYTAFLQENKTDISVSRKPGRSHVVSPSVIRTPGSAEVDIKGHTFDLYVNPRHGDTLFQDFVRRTLADLLKWNLIPAAELKRLQETDYSKKTFGLQFALFQREWRDCLDNTGKARYWSKKIGAFYVCSQWWKDNVVPVYEGKFAGWLEYLSRLYGNDSYLHLTIGQIVISKLWPLLESGQVDAAEIQKLTDSQYCKQKFDLDYPLLSKSCRYNSLGTSLCYKNRICINGEYFYVCYQWYNNSYPLLLQWLQEHSVPETIQFSPSSDTDIIAARTESTGPETVSVGVSSKIAAPAESTGPKTVFVNVNSRVAAPAEKANPEPVQAEQHDDSRTADLLFLEDAMKRIKECIARNGNVLSVKCARGYTPLMVAAQCDDADVLAVIIAKMKEANGNFEQRNDEGKTAYIVARESRAEKAMSLLKEAGARTDAAIIIARRKISAAEQNNCEKK